MKKIAIIVGHYGRGTGTSWKDRDEWELALRDARSLEARLRLDGKIEARVFSVDRDASAEPWSTVSKIAAEHRWLEEYNPDIAVDLHYNSAEDERAQGHELCYYRIGDWPVSLLEAMKAGLPNVSRGMKLREDLLVLKTQVCPIVIFEPAFIFEPQVEDLAWRQAVVDTLADGAYSYFFGDSWREKVPASPVYPYEGMQLKDGPGDDPAVEGDAGEPTIKPEGRVAAWKAEILERQPEAGVVAHKMSRLDRFIASPVYAGIRRGAQVGAHLAGWTLVNTAVLLAAGKDVGTALLSGAAAAGGEALVSISLVKTRKDQKAARGEEASKVAWIDALFYLLTLIVKYLRERKHKEVL